MFRTLVRNPPLRLTLSKQILLQSCSLLARIALHTGYKFSIVHSFSYGQKKSTHFLKNHSCLTSSTIQKIGAKWKLWILSSYQYLRNLYGLQAWQVGHFSQKYPEQRKVHPFQCAKNCFCLTFFQNADRDSRICFYETKFPWLQS